MVPLLLPVLTACTSTPQPELLVSAGPSHALAVDANGSRQGSLRIAPAELATGAIAARPAPTPPAAERAVLIAATPPPRAMPPVVRPAIPASLPPSGRAEVGIASLYWQEQMTSTGERFDPTQMTAAHKTLPLNSRIRVTNLSNGRSVVVRINDRGPFVAGRIVDLSLAAGEAIGLTRNTGLTQVRLEPL